MRIELVTEGGFAALPGLQRPLVLDGAALPPDQAAECARLVRETLAAAPAAGAPAAGSPAAGSPAAALRDGRRYSMKIACDGQVHSCTASDLAMSPAYRSLLELVRTHGRRLP